MNVDSARDDLAYLRALVQPDDDWQRRLGEGYFAAGLCYGVQMLLHGLQVLGYLTSPTFGLVIGFGPTVVFLGLMVWITARHRTVPTPGVAGRAVAAVFAWVGLGNLALIAIIGSVAWRAQSLEIWLIYPCVVMVLQGIAWGVAWAVRRRAWLGFVAIGWFSVGVGMGFAIRNIPALLIITGFGLLCFMVVPGWVMMRGPKASPSP